MRVGRFARADIILIRVGEKGCKVGSDVITLLVKGDCGYMDVMHNNTK